MGIANDCNVCALWTWQVCGMANAVKVIIQLISLLNKCSCSCSSTSHCWCFVIPLPNACCNVKVRLPNFQQYQTSKVCTTEFHFSHMTVIWTVLSWFLMSLEGWPNCWINCDARSAHALWYFDIACYDSDPDLPVRSEKSLSGVRTRRPMRSPVPLQLPPPSDVLKRTRVVHQAPWNCCSRLIASHGKCSRWCTFIERGRTFSFCCDIILEILLSFLASICSSESGGCLNLSSCIHLLSL